MIWRSKYVEYFVLGSVAVILVMLAVLSQTSATNVYAKVILVAAGGC